MNQEQQVVNDFFSKFKKYNTEILAMSWILIAICFMVHLVVVLVGYESMVQSTFLFDKENRMTVGLLLFLSPILGFLRMFPYWTFNKNRKNTALNELLKYHPIDRKQICNMMCEKLIKFMLKLLLYNIVILVFMGLLRGEIISWIYLFYVFILTFVWPVIINIIWIYVKK